MHKRCDEATFILTLFFPITITLNTSCQIQVKTHVVAGVLGFTRGNNVVKNHFKLLTSPSYRWERERVRVQERWTQRNGMENKIGNCKGLKLFWKLLPIRNTGIILSTISYTGLKVDVVLIKHVFTYTCYHAVIANSVFVNTHHASEKVRCPCV
jgi:hypothetical protein